MFQRPEGISAIDSNLDAVVDTLDNVVDAKYIIQHLLEMVVDKGVAAHRRNFSHKVNRLINYYEVGPIFSPAFSVVTQLICDCFRSCL